MTSPKRCGSSVPRAELGDLGDQRGRQVVDHEEAEVLEHVGRGRAPGARHAGDDGDVERHRAAHASRRVAVLAVQLRVAPHAPTCSGSHGIATSSSSVSARSRLTDRAP